MQSAVATTFELDDPAGAAGELADAVRERLDLAGHSIGILLCDADMDVAALSLELKNLLGFEIIGMTTLAVLDNQGHQSAAAVLTVLTADDCLFCPNLSEPLGGADHAEHIRQAFAGARPADQPPGSKPGLMIGFCPPGLPFSGDAFPDILSEVWPGTPLIGGMASDDYDYERVRVFLSGREYQDRLAALAVWGEVRPVFAMRHVTTSLAERVRPVTRAEGNVVYTVGEQSFVEYLESFGLKTDVEDALFAFTALPMMLSHEQGEEVPLMRNIGSLNLEDGSGSLLGDVPVGAMASMCLIDKQTISESCKQSFLALLEEGARQPDYDYSTILCMSCCGRSMVLGPDADTEGNILAGLKPDRLNLAGAYCLGEICPAFHDRERVSNRFHNCSITFCMI